jgi:hypothetical protein
MVKPPVVLVLGAGAGFDIGMPLGSRLQEDINNYSRVANDEDAHGRQRLVDRKVMDALRGLCRGESTAKHIEAIKRVHGGVYTRASIDDYLDRHRSNKIVNACGKLLIARAILESEGRSLLHFSRDNIFNTLNFDKIRGSWMIRFWQMLGRGMATEEISESLDHITFINFNYDRCLEHFLIQAFRGLDNWAEDTAYEFVYDRVKIFHPYGTLGRLRHPHRNEGVEFGAENSDLISIGERIRTYTEQAMDRMLLDQVRLAVARANTLIFLGFHFHRQNMDLIKPEGQSVVQRTFATALGISEQDQEVVRSQIGSLISADLSYQYERYRLEFVDGDCAELFRRFEKTLAF